MKHVQSYAALHKYLIRSIYWTLFMQELQPFIIQGRQGQHLQTPHRKVTSHGLKPRSSEYITADLMSPASDGALCTWNDKQRQAKNVCTGWIIKRFVPYRANETTQPWKWRGQIVVIVNIYHSCWKLANVSKRHSHSARLRSSWLYQFKIL